MLKKLFAMASRLDKLANKLKSWYNSRGILWGLFILLIGIFGLLLVVDVLASLLGLMMLYLPWLCTFIILTCLAVPFGILVLTLFVPFVEALSSTQFPKMVSEWAWKIGITFSGFLLFFSVSLGFFGGRGPLGIQGVARKKFVSNKTQYPIAACEGIAVDSEGKVYLAIQAYHRIQVYTGEGNFIEGWFIDPYNEGAFDIWIENNLLHSIQARGNVHKIFNLKGQLLKSTENLSFEEYVRLCDKAGGLKEEDNFGNTYLIKSPTLLPQVVKVGSDGQQNILIKNPFYFLLVRFPGPLWFVGLASLIITGILALIIKLNFA